MMLAGKIWTAFDEGDQEALGAVLRRQEIGFLDNEVKTSVILIKTYTRD